MRSYLEIIEDLKDGKLPDYEEVRLTALMANYLLHFSEQSIVRLTGFATNKQKTDLQSMLAVKAYESSFKSKKLPPEEYLGSWHPDAPGRQEDRQTHQKIFDNIMKKIEEGKK